MFKGFGKTGKSDVKPVKGGDNIDINLLGLRNRDKFAQSDDEEIPVHKEDDNIAPEVEKEIQVEEQDIQTPPNYSIVPEPANEEIVTLEEVEKSIKDRKQSLMKKTSSTLLPAVIRKKEIIAPEKVTVNTKQETINKEQKNPASLKVRRAKNKYKTAHNPTFIEELNRVEYSDSIFHELSEDTRLEEDAKAVAEEVSKLSKAIRFKSSLKIKEPVKVVKERKPIIPEFEEIITPSVAIVEQTAPRVSNTKKEIIVQKRSLVPMIVPLILILNILALLFIFNFNKAPEQKSILGESTDTLRDKQIAYISEGNVFVYTNSQKLQITNDGTLFNSYKNISWIDKDNLGFTFCLESDCQILSYSFDSKEISNLTSVSSAGINAAHWIEIDDVLLNITNNNRTHEILRVSPSSQTSVYSYTNNSKYNSPDDAIGFLATNDKAHFMAYNTALEGENEAVIFDRSNRQLSLIPNDIAKPFIDENNNIYFKAQDKLFKAQLNSIYSQVIVDYFSGFDPEFYNDDKKLIYWTVKNKQGIIESYDLETLTTTLVKNDTIKPVKFDDSSFVALKLSHDDYSPDNPKQLILFDLQGNERIIESRNVTKFSVSKY